MATLDVARGVVYSGVMKTLSGSSLLLLIQTPPDSERVGVVGQVLDLCLGWEDTVFLNLSSQSYRLRNYTTMLSLVANTFGTSPFLIGSPRQRESPSVSCANT